MFIHFGRLFFCISGPVRVHPSKAGKWIITFYKKTLVNWSISNIKIFLYKYLNPRVGLPKGMVSTPSHYKDFSRSVKALYSVIEKFQLIVGSSFSDIFWEKLKPYLKLDSQNNRECGCHLAIFIFALNLKNHVYVIINI